MLLSNGKVLDGVWDLFSLTNFPSCRECRDLQSLEEELRQIGLKDKAQFEDRYLTMMTSLTPKSSMKIKMTKRFRHMPSTVPEQRTMSRCPCPKTVIVNRRH